ncbi:MAG: N-acetylmuramoyl-L-alanine amidase [Cyclobacteriaceae bacterium]|nr:N-acetylmuramoyl-L-alanine amidase [Cyclobacteriaceae bacterium]
MHKVKNKKVKVAGRTTGVKIDSLSFAEKFAVLRKGIANRLNILLTVGNIGLVLLSLAITLLNFDSSAQNGGQNGSSKKFIVCIDPGHGGTQPGTFGKFTKEKDITLKLGLKLGEILEKNMPDVKVVYTRKTDITIGLKERAKVANDNHADLFISIHANSLPENTPDQRRQSIFGTETYVLGLHKSQESLEVAMRENSVILLEENYEEKYQGFDPKSPESYILFSLTQSANHESSIYFADLVEKQFGDKAGRKSRGVKQAGFQVLWETAMPAVLIEIGYLSNTKEEKELSDAQVQEYIASAIFRAIRDYKNKVKSLN